MTIGLTVGLNFSAAHAATISSVSSVATVTGNQIITSPNGKFTVKMQTDGNLVVYNATGTATWNSGTASNPGAKLSIQDDGNVVIYNTEGTAKWSSGTGGQATSTTLKMQDDGNLVLYTSGGIPLWSTFNGRLNAYQERLQVGQTLRTGWSLVSTDLRYKASMQSDGNLVVYNGTTAEFSTGTSGTNHLDLQADGNIVVCNSQQTHVWDSGTNGYSNTPILTMRTDGVLALTADSGIVLWTSAGGRVIDGAVAAVVAADINHRNAQSLVAGSAQIAQYPKPTSSLTSARSSAVTTQDNQLKTQRNLYVSNGELLSSFSSSYSVSSLNVSGTTATAQLTEATSMSRANGSETEARSKYSYTLQQTATLVYSSGAWKLDGLKHPIITDDQIPETILPSASSVAAQANGTTAQALATSVGSGVFTQSPDAIKNADVAQAASDSALKSTDRMQVQTAHDGTTTYRDGIIDYAKKWATARNPDFKSLDDDCSNFVSQALYSGGWNQAFGLQNDENAWFGNLFLVSDTWGKAQPLFDYGFHTTGRLKYKEPTARPQEGDLTFWIWNDEDGLNYVFDHSSIVTAVDPEGQPYYSYHSYDTYNKSLTAIMAQNAGSIYSTWGYN